MSSVSNSCLNVQEGCHPAEAGFTAFHDVYWEASCADFTSQSVHMGILCLNFTFLGSLGISIETFIYFFSKQITQNAK